MSKLTISLSDETASDVSRVEIAFKKPGQNNPGDKLRDMFTEAQSIIATGTGVTITFEYNSGDKKSVYIDGDGADRILEVK
jgi:hypothetical protein